MKNSNLLRLAGFGFFGAVFLSPAPGQNEGNWLLERLSISRKITSMPFSMSALYRENYLMESNTTAHPPASIPKPDFFFSICFTEEPLPDTTTSLFPFYKTTTNTPAPKSESPAAQAQTTLIETTPVSPEKNEPELVTTAESNTAATLPVEQSLLSQEPDEITEEYISVNNSHLPEYLPGEKENEEERIFPPTEYVDEVVIPKKQEMEKTFGSGLAPIITTDPEAGLDTYPADLMQVRIQELAAYANENNYSTQYAFIINLGLKSGRKRFFMIDLLQGIIVKSGLVAHGRGKEKFTLHKRYSNMFGSACSSLGLYKIGPAYRGGFGKSFRLIGLEKTNNNALSRAIVLHAMNCIPNEEIAYPICQSEGCPSLSPEFLEEISPVIMKSEKPMLLWVFDPAIDHNRFL